MLQCEILFPEFRIGHHPQENTSHHRPGLEADLLSVALREANEESGVLAAPVSPDIFSLEILHVAPHVKRGKFVCAHLHLNATYLLEADDKSPICCKPDENSAVRWLSLQDVLPSVSEPAMRPVYQKLMEKAARQT